MQQGGAYSIKKMNNEPLLNTDKADDKALLPLINISTSGWTVVVIHFDPLTKTSSYYAQMFMVAFC